MKCHPVKGTTVSICDVVAFENRQPITDAKFITVE